MKFPKSKVGIWFVILYLLLALGGYLYLAFQTECLDKNYAGWGFECIPVLLFAFPFWIGFTLLMDSLNIDLDYVFNLIDWSFKSTYVILAIVHIILVYLVGFGIEKLIRRSLNPKS